MSFSGRMVDGCTQRLGNIIQIKRNILMLHIALQGNLRTTEGWFQSSELWKSVGKKSQVSKKKNHTLHDSIYISFLRWQNYRDREQVNGCQELRQGGVEGG